MVFVDTCSNINWRGEALLGRRDSHKPLTAVILLILVASTGFAGGMGEVGSDDGRELPDPEESLEQADERINIREFDEAVPSLVDAVRADDEQLPAAEQRFDRIRDARRAYIEKGRQVEAELRDLISGEIPRDEVLPTAFQALRLIDEMYDILPYPNPEDEELIGELQSRVLLTIDRRRFEALMDAALVEIEAGNYVRAVEIYINGLGEYGFESPAAPDGDADAGSQVAQGEAEIEALLETDGIAIQIRSFDPDDYGITGERFAAARETVRADAVAAAADADSTFVAVAEPAEQQAREMISAFAAGEFENAREQIEDYLPLLREITAVYRSILQASEVIAEQEGVNAQRAVAGEEYRYNWHIRFVNDIVLGRPVNDAGDARREEGVLHVVESVWDVVANGPVAATREFGADRYAMAVEELRSFEWENRTSPGDDQVVLEHVQETTDTLESVAVSYRTTIEILDVARALDLTLPPRGDGSSATTLVPPAERIAELGDGALVRTLAEAVARTASAEELEAVVATGQSAYQVATPLASRTSVTELGGQRSDIRSRLDELYRHADRWRRFTRIGGDGDQTADALLAEAAPEHGAYIDDRIGRVREYELVVVRRIANIRLSNLEERLASYRSAVSAAERDLAATDPISNAPRPRAAEARDRLRSLVGSVSGTRVTSTATGTLRALRGDAADLAGELRDEDDYVVPDAEIQRVITRADGIAATVGTDTEGVLGTARSLLERSLAQIDQAEELRQDALARVDEIDAQINEAEARNDAGEVLEASLLLDDAENLLSSNDPEDASNLFTASLENWYRDEVEAEWDRLRDRLSGRLNDARRDIVLSRVNLLAEQAEPLLDPPAGEDPQPGEAILLLEEAEALWATVYPLIQNPVITPLLRRARILQSQQQQVLTEDIPGFERLSQILNTARTAFEERNYDTAQAALDFFLVEQPLNSEARLLDIRLEIATGDGSPDTVVRNYVTRSLEEVTQGEDDGAAVERAILDGSVSSEVFDNLLALRSKLRAIRQIADEEGGVGSSTLNRIEDLLSGIERVLDPPAPRTPPNPRRVADEIIDDLLARGDWQNLPVSEQTAIYEELVRARTIFPGYDRTEQLIGLMQSYLPTVRLPSPAEQAIMTRANRLVAQGDLNGALAELEAYMARAETTPTLQDPMLIPDWRSLYNDLIRRLRRQ